MKNYRLVLLIGTVEILIGSITLFSNLITLALGSNTKTPNVLLFVVVTGLISTFIGIGMLKFKRVAYQLLLYFSSVVVLSKVLIFMDIIQLNGALETTIPALFKRIVSTFYHLCVIYILTRENIKQIFHS